MVHCHRFLLAQFLWTVLLAGNASRLPAQEQSLGSVSENDRSQAETAEVVSLPEITGKTLPTIELQAPGLEQLLNHLETFRKAHTPFHIRHREVIKLRNASEVKAIESMGLPPGMLLDTEYESAFWDNRSWRRCLSLGVDGEQASDNRSRGDRDGTAGLDVPFALLGVFIEPKPENCKLTFDDIFPHITITADQHSDRAELWMFPVSGQWIPKRLRITPEDKEEPALEWEVHHIKAFGKDRPPQIIDGEGRWTIRNGDQATTITSEFFITKALYGDDVVPREIDASLAPMPAPPAAASLVDPPVINTPAASKGLQLRAQSPKVLVIETTPDIDRSAVIRKVVEAMEKDGRAKRGDIERVGKPVGLEAILSPVHDMSHEKIIKFIEVLQSLGVDRMRFSANNEQKESTVIIQCPPDIAWRKVRTMTEELEETGDFKVDVRVAASDEPVTPVAVESLPNANHVPPVLPGAEELPPPSKLQDVFSPFASRPAPEASERGDVKVFALQNIQANEAGRIIEQLYITTPGGHDSIAIRLSVDDRNNSLIVRGNSAVIAEVEALLLQLDTKQPVTEPVNNSSAIGGDGAGMRVNVPALGPDPLAVDFLVPVRGDGQTFTFSIGFNGQSADDLQRQYEALEQRARNLSDELRKPLPDPGKGEEMKSQIRDAVKQAFEARQKLQRAELTEFAQRLKGIQESIELRDKVSQQIIDRRVEELLDPNLKWDDPETSSSGRAPALRSDSFPSSNDKTTPDGSSRAATTYGHELDGSRDDSRQIPDDFDPADQVQFLLWGSLGIACEPSKVGTSADIKSALWVTHVRPGSPAALCDIRIKDSILQANTKETAHSVDLLDQWRESFASRSLKLRIQTGERILGREVLWPKTSVEPGVFGGWRLKTISGEGSQAILSGLRLESTALPTNEAHDSFGVWTMQSNNYNYALRLHVKMNTETHRIDLGSINDRGEMSDRCTGIWKLEGDQLHVALASNEKSPERPADFSGKTGMVQVWERTATRAAQATSQTPDGSRRAGTTLSPDLPHDVPYTDAPGLPLMVDPSESSSTGLEIHAVPDETLTWNLMGVVFRTKVADRAPGASIPTPDDRTQDGLWLEAVKVQEGGPAARAGLSVGDLLISIDRQPIHSADDISRAWQDAENASPSTVHIMRDGILLKSQLRWSSRLRQPLNVEGKVLTRAGDQLELLLGADDGLQVGNRLVIRSAKAQPVFHSAEIVSLQTDASVARIVVEEKRFPIEAGDIASFGLGLALESPPAIPVDDNELQPPKPAAHPMKLDDPLEPKPLEMPADAADFRRSESVPSELPSEKVQGKSTATVSNLSEFEPGYKPKSSAETALGKLVLVFFQDRSRRAVPCVVLKINKEYYAVTTGPATVVPDETPHAIDRSVVEWGDGSEMTVTYDERSTKELQLYRFADDAVIPEPLRSAAEMKVDKLPVIGFDLSLELGVSLTALTPVRAGSLSETRVRVSAINVSQKLTLPSQKVEHQYDGLFSVDAALPEGTPVFLEGKLMGLTILGSRFIGEEAQRSYVLPASRLWKLCNTLP